MNGFSNTALWVALAVLGYALGCANGAILTSKLFYHDDVRSHGSGNAGLTNFYRSYGAKLVLLVIAVDMLKAVVAVQLGGVLLGGALGKYFMGFFCMLGHMFPAPYHFKGGKGILSSGTLLLCLDWRVALVSWGAFIVLVLLTRYVSLGSVAAAVLLPVTTFFVYRSAPDFPWIMLLGTLIGGMVTWAHRENIRRLLNGTENKFSFHKSDKEAKP
ncbi:MAG: glycerol-3-phosphate 1-O-acyltransferase PlsY [Oscillospiraceae bacterium]|nr:glycerol-3-phosphate 1-O-acyltransferase PlsY [Oscillospiraceae bacterium]